MPRLHLAADRNFLHQRVFVRYSSPAGLFYHPAARIHALLRIEGENAIWRARMIEGETSTNKRFACPCFRSVTIIGTSIHVKSHFPAGSKFHFNLEGISFEFDFIQSDIFKHYSTVTLKTCSCITNFHTCNTANISRGEIGHKNSSHRPVYHINTCNVS